MDVELKKPTDLDFGNQCADFEEWEDPKWPEPLHKELDVTTFEDSNHGHDKVTGRSISGLISFVGRTPATWYSKRQPATKVSTYGAEFISLKSTIEEAVLTQHYLQSMGVKVTKPVTVFGDNRSVILSATNPGSPLKKKTEALSYHFCREHYSGRVIDVQWIESEENYANPFTKAVTSGEHHNTFGEVMTNS